MKTINGVNIYTAHEVAELLDSHHLTILRYIREGRILAVKKGRGYLITQENLMRYLNGETDRARKSREQKQK